MAVYYSVGDRIDFYTSFPANTIILAIFLFVFLFVYDKTRKKKRAFRIIISLVSALAFCTMIILVLSYATSGAYFQSGIGGI